MFEELTSGSLVAEVLMEDDGVSRILVIEGELEERLFKRLGDAGCKRVMGRGKHRIIEGVEQLLRHDRVFVMLDRDFHDFGEHRPRSPRLILTDHYNLEFSVLASSSGLNMFVDYCEIGLTSDVVLRDALELAEPLSLLRLAVYLNGWSLRLDKFPLGEVLGSDGRVDANQMAEKAIQRSARNLPPDRKLPSPAKIEYELTKVASRARSAGGQFLSGHDLSTALGLVARRAKAKRLLTPADVEALCGSAISLQCLLSLSSGLHLQAHGLLAA